MIITPFSGTAQNLSAEQAHFIDGNTNNVTSHIIGPEQVIAAQPAIWVIKGATSSLLTRISPLGADIISDNRAITIQYPAESCSPGDRYKGDTVGTVALAGTLRPAGGMHFMQPIPRCTRARLTYAVKFRTGFSWQGGGKLPGFASRLWDASGGVTDPTIAGTTSFTARHMWRPDGQLTPYYYMADNRADRWIGSGYSNSSLPTVNWQDAYYSGSTLFCTPAFMPTNQWNVIEQEIWLNDVGKSNGGSITTLNGKVISSRADLIWRWVPSLYIDSVFMSSFFGGNTFSDGDDSIWFTRTNQTIDISDIIVTKLA